MLLYANTTVSLCLLCVAYMRKILTVVLRKPPCQQGSPFS